MNDHFDEIWEVNLPESAVNLRDVAPKHRRNRVGDVFGDVEPGERFYIVSDRDLGPVPEYLLDLLDDGQRLESFETRRQNPDTWLARTVLTA